MANLTLTAVFEAVYQLETTDPVLGGPGGVSNQQAQNLGNRTEWLKAKLDALGGSGDAVSYSGNLDILRTNGFYLIRNAATNKPVSDDGMCIVCSISVNPDTGGVPSTLQVFVDNGVGTLYWRVMANGIVLPWSSAIIKTAYDSFLSSLVGMVSAFATATPPSGWLKCNGAAVSRSIYSALFARIGTAWGAGNGTTTFNVPDLRGEFVRGWADDRAGLYESGRFFASSQGDAMVQHVHSYNEPFNTAQAQAGTGQNVVVAIDTANPSGVAIAAGFPNPDPPPTAQETRPRNVAMSYFIRF